MNGLGRALLAAAVFLSPFGSVGLGEVLLGRSPGTGIQPAFVPLLLLCGLLLVQVARRPAWQPGERAVLEALLWTAAAASLTWSIRDMGLAGEVPWLKSVKQLLMWSFLAVSAVAVARVSRAGTGPHVERALAAGLFVACVLAVVRAVGGPEFTRFGFLDTNPSIAFGSDELYLGHSFTGIARLRGPMPEPLLLGSYLLAAVPLVTASAVARSGWARIWRAGIAALGLLCLLGTWSRGVWLGAAVAAVVLVGLAFRRGWIRRPGAAFLAGGLASVVLGLLVLAIATGVSPLEVVDLGVRRLRQSAALHDMSNMTRFWAWAVAWEIFREAPVQGAGWGSYGFLFFRHASEAASTAHFGWPVPNNLALLVLAECGLIGFALWCRALGPALAPLFRPGAGRPAALLAVALLGVLAQFATFSQWNLPHFWVLAGAALGAATAPDAGRA